MKCLINEITDFTITIHLIVMQSEFLSVQQRDLRRTSLIGIVATTCASTNLEAQRHGGKHYDTAAVLIPKVEEAR